MNELLIIGAGGHGRVVAEIAELLGYDKIDFLDDSYNGPNSSRVIGKLHEYTAFFETYQNAVVAIGNNEVRYEWVKRLIDFGYQMPPVIHPSADISKSAKIGAGSVILQHTVVNTGTVLGRGCIVNIGALIDHDCIIGEGAHISSGAVVRSMVQAGNLCYLGAGTLVSSFTVIEDKAVIPDGSIAYKRDGEKCVL